MKMDIHADPPKCLPKRRQAHIVSAVKEEVRELDEEYFSHLYKFREDTYKLQRELDYKAEGSLYSLL